MKSDAGCFINGVKNIYLNQDEVCYHFVQWEKISQKRFLLNRKIRLRIFWSETIALIQQENELHFKFRGKDHCGINRVDQTIRIAVPQNTHSNKQKEKNTLFIYSGHQVRLRKDRTSSVRSRWFLHPLKKKN